MAGKEWAARVAAARAAVLREVVQLVAGERQEELTAAGPMEVLPGAVETWVAMEASVAATEAATEAVGQEAAERVWARVAEALVVMVRAADTMAVAGTEAAKVVEAQQVVGSCTTASSMGGSAPLAAHQAARSRHGMHWVPLG